MTTPTLTTEPTEPVTVHVGDVGTFYKCRIQDDGTPFDPSFAITKELIFRPPQVSPIIKPASVVSEDGEWYLTYIAEAGFHAVPGWWKVQGHLIFGDGQEFHSTSETYQVSPNLSK